jgi:predicted Rossmann-fold nucleotide-binding protein
MKSHRRTIIGVIGGDDTGQAANACRVGAAIARSGHIVLTGREPKKGSLQVSEAAAYGAVIATSDLGVIARIISVVPDVPLEPLSTSVTPNVRHLAVRTGLKSEERDAINGVTPDVMIALEGGTGTLTEVAFAYECGTPIVLFRSRHQLTRKFNEHRRRTPFGGGDGNLERFLRAAVRVYPVLGGRRQDIKRLESGVGTALKHGHEIDALDCQLVVDTAISYAFSYADKRHGAFPGLPPDFEGTREAFQSALGDFE